MPEGKADSENASKMGTTRFWLKGYVVNFSLSRGKSNEFACMLAAYLYMRYYQILRRSLPLSPFPYVTLLPIWTRQPSAQTRTTPTLCLSEPSG